MLLPEDADRVVILDRPRPVERGLRLHTFDCLPPDPWSGGKVSPLRRWRFGGAPTLRFSSPLRRSPATTGSTDGSFRAATGVGDFDRGSPIVVNNAG